VQCAKGDKETPPVLGFSRELWTGRRSATSRQSTAVERHTEVPQASRESAGRQQWAEHRLEAVREGQVGEPGGTDFEPEAERSSGSCAKGK